MHEKNKVISFDYGDTLCKGRERSYVVAYKVLKKIGFEFELPEVKEAWEKADLWWKNLMKERGLIMTAENFVSLIQKMLLDLNINNDSSYLIAKQLYEHWPHEVDVEVYEDTLPALNELKNANFRLIVISNISSGKNLRIYLQKAGILEYFSAVIASGDVGYEKPSPEIFKVASKIMNVPLSCMLHIGNSYEKDYLGACNAGLNAILLDREGKYIDKKCQRASNLIEAVNMLRQCFAPF